MIKIEKLVRPNILNLNPYSSARDEFTGEEGIFLDANENPYGALNRYPDPYQKKLKQKLAEIKGVDSNSIFVGNGSDEVIDLAYRIFCRPGIDKAITFSPSYGMYEVSAAINNVSLVKLPLNEEFQINIEQLQPYFQDNSIKLLFICSPNNPTGNLIHFSAIEYILNNFNGIVIIDEAYIDFAKSESLISLINTYNNLIISQTFSKAWGLAAVRVGTAFANPNIISFFNKVKPPYNVSLLNQQEVLQALNYKTRKDLIETIIKEKKRVIVELEKIESIKTIYPSDTNFLLIKVANANEMYQELVQQKIIIRNRNSQINGCLRITIGNVQENNNLINAIKKYYEKSIIYR